MEITIFFGNTLRQKKLKTSNRYRCMVGTMDIMVGSSKAKTIETFEPNPDILPDLKQNTNKLNNCTVHNTALGDTTGKVSMQYETHTGTCHIKDYNGSINLRTLDSYNFQDVDIIKIDVEGFRNTCIRRCKTNNTLTTSMDTNRRKQFWKKIWKI